MIKILLGAVAAWAAIHYFTQPAPSATTIPTGTDSLATGHLPAFPVPVPVATAPAIYVPPAAPVSGTYQTASPTAFLSRAVGMFEGAIPTVPSIPMTAWAPAPPYAIGGIASGIGAGGNPLGGPLVPGVSVGTGTTKPINPFAPLVIA